MNRLFAASLALGLFGSGCATPQPRAPEVVMERHAQKRASSRLDELQLNAATRARVNKLVSRVRAEFADYEVARIELLDEILVEVRAGKLDRARLDPLLKKTIATFRKGLPALLDGVNELHRLLPRSERERLVELLGGDGPEKSREEKRAERDEKIGRVLDLTTGQKTTLYPGLLAIVLKHYGFITDIQDQIEDAEDAFILPGFDAHKLELMQNLDLPRMADIYFELLESAMNHLNEDQRQTLAAVIDASVRGD